MAARRPFVDWVTSSTGQANTHEIVELELPDSFQLSDRLLNARRDDDFAGPESSGLTRR